MKHFNNQIMCLIYQTILSTIQHTNTASQKNILQIYLFLFFFKYTYIMICLQQQETKKILNHNYYFYMVSDMGFNNNF